MTVLSQMAGRLHAEVSRRLDRLPAEAQRIPLGVPLGGEGEACDALRAAASGYVGDLPLDTIETGLDVIAEVGDLGEPEIQVLGLVALSGLDDRIARAIGLLQDDLSRTRPSAGLLARLLDGVVPRSEVMSAVGPDGRLCRTGLVDIVGPYGDGRAPTSCMEVALHPRALEALLAGGRLGVPDPRLYAALRLDAAVGAPAEPEDLVARLIGLRGATRVPGVLCVGPEIATALDLAHAVAGRAAASVMVVHVEAALALGETPESLERSVRREAVLLRALPVWTALPGRDALADVATERRIASMLVRAPWPLIVHAESMITPPSDIPLTLIALPAPIQGYRLRAAHWNGGAGVGPGLPPGPAEALGAAFAIPRGAVVAARAHAEAAQALFGGDPTAHHQRAAQRQAATRLLRFAVKVTPRATWDDLVVPPGVRTQLREIEWRVAHRVRVLEEFGFAVGAAGRRGFLGLFAGPSGTGKTMAAEIIAHAQGFDLYRVDLSALVSKYVGETEKNLSQIFEDCESARAILFFDEADALFGKRSSVKDAHDRYANIETNYLLQRVEVFDGVVLLATNLRQNLEDALLRRLDIVVEFPFPDDAAREDIWRRVWPGSVDLEPQIDFGLIARRFKLAGGSIRNCAMDAAFRAAARNGGHRRLSVRATDIDLALGREYQKLGRPVTRAEFGAAYTAVMDGLFAEPADAAHG